MLLLKTPQTSFFRASEADFLRELLRFFFFFFFFFVFDFLEAAFVLEDFLAAFLAIFGGFPGNFERSKSAQRGWIELIFVTETYVREIRK
jgi:hypothetical protein